MNAAPSEDNFRPFTETDRRNAMLVRTVKCRVFSGRVDEKTATV
jgi:hypothetical protein